MTVDELTGPLTASIPASEGALALADELGRVAAGDVPDGFRAEVPDRILDAENGKLTKHKGDFIRFCRVAAARGNDDLDVSDQTVRRWVEELEALGVFDRGEYVYRKGEPFTFATALLRRVGETLDAPEAFDVAARRALRRATESAASATEWLPAIRDLVDLNGPDGDGGGRAPPGAAPADD